VSRRGNEARRPGGDDAAWRERAEDVVAATASTGSKRPLALYGPDEDARTGPTPLHFQFASGCRVVTMDERELVDLTMALGSVALGYADAEVARCVARTAAEGNVAGLTHWREVDVAERLVDVIPCAERVLFLKTGAEAVAAAVRLARTYTSRATVIAAGYFGWLDWASYGPTEGVPAAARADVVRVTWNDVDALERAATAAGRDLAAVVVEPVVERLPDAAWIAAARRVCDRVGAVLVFDEVKTGFRLRPGGYQELSGHEPDLAVFGKALANGYPLSAVVGRADVMDAARRTWVSSTLASEASALAAAGAVLDRHDAIDVCARLAEHGRALRCGVAGALEASGLRGVEVAGLDPMWLLRWDDPHREARFLATARGFGGAKTPGVLFKRGAYNFAALAHDAEAVRLVERAAAAAFAAVARADEARP
jgi:glutamate-1-semialdehyde 2,1-aminomutase